MSENDKKLRELFKQLPTEGPSMGFDDRLMRKIAKLADAKERKKKASRVIFIAVGIIGGLASLTGLIWFLFNYYGIELNISKPSWATLEFELPKIEFPSMLVILAIAVLLLLSADMLIRRHRFSKREKEKHANLL